MWIGFKWLRISSVVGSYELQGFKEMSFLVSLSRKTLFHPSNPPHCQTVILWK
jgi:hypothetical protein